MRLLPYLLVGAFLTPLGVQAQNAITQEGTVLQNSPSMFTGDRRMRQGAPAAGATTGRIVTTGSGVVGGDCDFSGPTDTAGGYNRLCLDAANGRLLFESTKAVPPGLKFTVLGVDYPFFGSGNGNVQGPTPTTVNELASWNSTTGAALRQGPATLTDTKTAAITTEGAGLAGFSKSGQTANQILQWAGLSTGISYDAVRGVATQPAGTTTHLVNAVGGYLVADAATSPAFPASVVLFGAGVARTNGTKVWGINTLMSDSTSAGVTADTGKALNNEFDFNVHSPNTTILGLQLAGDSLVQPASAYGVALQPLDLATPAGSVAKWTAFLVSTPGSTNTFASIGPKSVAGPSINSQELVFNWYDAASAVQTTVVGATPTGLIVVGSGAAITSSVSAQGGFYIGDNAGVTINNRPSLVGAGTLLSMGSDTGWVNVNVGNTTGTLNLVTGTSVTILNGKPMQFVAAAAPASPPAGAWYVYTDSGDGNKLKAKASTGTVVTLGTP